MNLTEEQHLKFFSFVIKIIYTTSVSNKLFFGNFILLFFTHFYNAIIHLNLNKSQNKEIIFHKMKFRLPLVWAGK